MTPEQIIQIGELLSGLPLHGLMLVAVIVLWLDLRKTRQALDNCLRGNALNTKRINALDAWVAQVEEMSK